MEKRERRTFVDKQLGIISEEEIWAESKMKNEKLNFGCKI